MKQTDTHVYFVGGYLSNWYGCNISLPLVDGIRPTDFNNSEQAFMAFKALHFADYRTLQLILDEPIPAQQKLLGRQVENFDIAEWERVARDYMLRVNIAKFEQHADLRLKLIETGDRKLVEAAWYDRVWGVGLREDDPLILDEANWLGTNWLGETLMITRGAMHDFNRFLARNDSIHG